MAHSLILGMSESGKTTLAKRLSREYRAAGVGVLVLDPLRDPEWHADFITTDPKEFLATFWKSRSCMAFIDEAGEAIGRYDAAMQACVTRGRHWGHSVHVITQRGAQLSPTVRDQCRHLFLFCSSRQDGELLAREWNHADLAKCASLRQFEYMHASRFGGLERKILNGGNDNASPDMARPDADRRRISGTEGREEARSGVNGSAASGTGSASDASAAD